MFSCGKFGLEFTEASARPKDVHRKHKVTCALWQTYTFRFGGTSVAAALQSAVSSRNGDGGGGGGVVEL